MSGAGRAMVLTTREVAGLARVHEATISRLVREGSLEAVRVGRQIRIPRCAVERLLGVAKSQNPESPSPPSPAAA